MSLFHTSPHDWLPQGHIFHFISEVVEHSDLSGIYNHYSELWGQPTYQPSMLVEILIYAYSKGRDYTGTSLFI
jgi:transposase